MKVVASLVYFCTLILQIFCGDISNQKCEEYGRAVYARQESPLMLRRSSHNSVSECGIVSVPLIIGGKRAEPKEFPHMALIGFGFNSNSKLSWYCGGSLISEDYVLTAGHCLSSREKGPAQKVKFGALSMHLYSDDTEVQEKCVAKRISHPNFKPPSKYNDIGLIRLDSPVRFTPYVRPGCLKAAPYYQKDAIAIGFGKTNYESGSGSEYLMKVQLNIISNDICSGYFDSEVRSGKMSHGLDNTVLCAGVLSGGKDTCQGDSGGPLQIVLEEPYCMYGIIGITSFGKFCGFEESPAIYTRVSGYIDWIENKVWGRKYG